eukprot:15365617-Ditylum_brightwellii.AAC.1
MDDHQDNVTYFMVNIDTNPRLLCCLADSCDSRSKVKHLQDLSVREKQLEEEAKLIEDHEDFPPNFPGFYHGDRKGMSLEGMLLGERITFHQRFAMPFCDNSWGAVSPFGIERMPIQKSSIEWIRSDDNDNDNDDQDDETLKMIHKESYGWN